MRGFLVALALAPLLLGCVRLIDLPPGLPEEGRVVREVEIDGHGKVDDALVTDGLEMHPPEGMVRIK